MSQVRIAHHGATFARWLQRRQPVTSGGTRRSPTAAALCAPPHSAAHARAALAGFRHAAFTFGAESLVAKSNINGAKIPPGQLISFVQKGIMYQELERSVADDGSVAGSSERAPAAA